MNLSFNLEITADRPIIELNDIFNGCNALLDTGALFPLWTKDKDLLLGIGAKPYKAGVSFTGFGGEVFGDIYILDLCLGGLMYPGMHIMHCEDNSIPGYFIFSATMFNKMIYTVDNIEKKFNITTPDNQRCYNLSIFDSKGALHVLCSAE